MLPLLCSYLIHVTCKQSTDTAQGTIMTGPQTPHKGKEESLLLPLTELHYEPHNVVIVLLAKLYIQSIDEFSIPVCSVVHMKTGSWVTDITVIMISQYPENVMISVTTATNSHNTPSPRDL